MQTPSHSVVQYVRNKKKPHGALVAIKTPDGFRIGYSLCRKGDRFKKKMAVQIAIGRATHSHSLEAQELPREIKKMIPVFTERCRKYYRT
jgi:hypothetical protein